MISLSPRDENKNKYLNNAKISAQQSFLYHKSSPKVKWEANVQLMSVGSGGGVWVVSPRSQNTLNINI